MSYAHGSWPFGEWETRSNVCSRLPEVSSSCSRHHDVLVLRAYISTLFNILTVLRFGPDFALHV